MVDEVKYSFENLEKANLKLKEGLSQPMSEIVRDGVIQRFEFTFELLWKTLKIFLREEGYDLTTPKDCLKQAFRLDWLKEEQVFDQMIKDRNITSHEYAQKKADEIFKRIKGEYVLAFENTINTLGKIFKKKYDSSK